MNFETTQHTNYVLITSQVEKLDASNASELKEVINVLNKDGVNSLIIDFSKTKYSDSTGLSAILLANRLCKDSNGKAVFMNLQPIVRKVISIAQLDKVLNIADDMEQANTLLAN